MHKIGYLYVCLAAVLWAAAGSAAKFLFNSGMTAYQLIQLRVTLAFCGLLLWLVWRNRPLLKIKVKDLFYFCLLGVLGIGAAQFFYLFAISKIKVAAAILLHYTGPVFVALYAAVFRHQKAPAFIEIRHPGVEIPPLSESKAPPLARRDVDAGACPPLSRSR